MKISKFDKIPGIINETQKIDEVQIKEIEEILGFALPKEYIQFLKKYNGGYTNGFGYKYENGVDEISHFYSILKDSENNNPLDLKMKIISKKGDMEDYYGVQKLSFVPIGSFTGDLSILLDKEGKVYIQDDRNLEEFKVDKIADDFQTFFKGFVKESTPKVITRDHPMVRRCNDLEKKEQLYLSLKKDEEEKREKKYTPLEDLYS